MGRLSKSLRMLMATAATAAIVAVATAPAAAASFSDVSDRYEEAVGYLVNDGVTNGLTDSSFGVSQQIKRADAAVMIARALDLESKDAPDAGFTDVPQRAQSAVNSLRQEGIINGKTASSFGANDKLTRGEMAIILTRAYHFGGTGEVPFTDVNSRYMDYVKALVANGITKGKTETQFGTGQKITRGEFALFIYRSEKSIEPKVINVSSLEDMSVTEGEKVNLPGKIEVTLEDNTKAQKEVVWDEADFSKAGEYIVKGDVADSDLQAKIKVVIKESEATLAVKKADEAIAALPTEITLENEDVVKEARSFVDAAYQLNDQADIEGIAVLEKAESMIAFLHAKEDAENAIAALPASITLAEKAAVDAARTKVEAVYNLDKNADVEGIAILKKAEDALALLEAKEMAEKAIAGLPEIVTLNEQNAVKTARVKVDDVLNMDSSVSIEGIDKLEAAEQEIHRLLVESAVVRLNTSGKKLKTNKTYQLTSTVTPDEVSDLAVAWSSDNPNVATVDQNGVVKTISEGEATITAQLEKGHTAVCQITVSNKPDLSFNTYASMTINGVINGVNTSFYNLSEDTIQVEKVEVYEGSTKRAEFSAQNMQDSGITTEIPAYQQFGMSISFKLGLWATSENYVKYTISVGDDTYEYISNINN
ncbi:S-layer homology domain-containing protein [Falsibacillus albus]|uniref:SLH domain-containing protein n=1 Tax=Falsibacillus albus TaxID=2478915 RepID=A0A3L7JYT5_9BACI|nr:S-layer homology domain-containing protein [Falsibacillus albus]RLQ94871.1 hypothetical protein D9X91_12870 [Falsibacillus albus]